MVTTLSQDDALAAVPLVSIVMPTYNSADTIESTISSVTHQKYLNWELLVTDDSSVDATWDVLRALSKEDKRIKPVKLSKNSGAAVARNTSISRAEGKYLAFLDGDDLWLKDKLSQQVAFMESNNILFSYTSYTVLHEDSSEVSSKVVDGYDHEKVSYSDMLRKKSTMGCSTVMLNREKLTDIEMPLIRTAQDYATWLKILRKNDCYAFCLREPLTQYRIRSNSISRNKFKKTMRQWQVYRSIENIGVVKSLYFMFFYAFRAVFRR